MWPHKGEPESQRGSKEAFNQHSLFVIWKFTLVLDIWYESIANLSKQNIGKKGRPKVCKWDLYTLFLLMCTFFRFYRYKKKLEGVMGICHFCLRKKLLNNIKLYVSIELNLLKLAELKYFPLIYLVRFTKFNGQHNLLCTICCQSN